MAVEFVMGELRELIMEVELLSSPSSRKAALLEFGRVGVMESFILVEGAGAAEPESSPPEIFIMEKYNY